MLTWGNEEELKKDIQVSHQVSKGSLGMGYVCGFKAANAVMQGTLTHDLQYLFLAGVPGKGTAGLSEIVLWKYILIGPRNGHSHAHTPIHVSHTHTRTRSRTCARARARTRTHTHTHTPGSVGVDPLRGKEMRDVVLGWVGRLMGSGDEGRDGGEVSCKKRWTK